MGPVAVKIAIILILEVTLHYLGSLVVTGRSPADQFERMVNDAWPWAYLASHFLLLLALLPWWLRNDIDPRRGKYADLVRITLVSLTSAMCVLLIHVLMPFDRQRSDFGNEGPVVGLASVLSTLILPMLFRAFLRRTPRLQDFLFFRYHASISSERQRESYARMKSVAEELEHTIYDIPTGRAVAIADLLDRTARLRFTNAVLLVLIIALLTGTAVFIIFAGQIANRDSESTNAIRQIRTSIDQESKGLEESRLELIGARTRLEATVKRLQAPAGASSPRADSDVVAQKAQAEFAETSIKERETEIARLRKLLDAVETAAYTVGTNASSYNSNLLQLWTSQIIRFGIIAVVIYLVQILVGLYRYNAQLASHYCAQSDALLLVGTSSDGALKSLTSLRPIFGFGKVQESIPEKVVDRLADIIKAAAEKVSDSKSK